MICLSNLIRNCLLGFLAVAMTLGAASAQDGQKMLQESKRKFAQYSLNPSNASSLDEARKLVDQAVSTPEVRGTAKGWMTRGEVYNALVGKDVNRLFSPH